MSKAFEKFLEQSKKAGFTIYPGDIHHAAYIAWNAAIEHAAKVCDNLKSDDYCVDVRQAAEAIRKEKTE